MTKPKHGCCYGGVFSITLNAAVFLCLLLHLATALPEITLEDFTVFALKQNTGIALKESTNSTQYNNTIHFDLKLRNLDKESMDYDALNLTFYYKTNLSSFPIGNATFRAFYQRRYGSDHRVGNIEVRGVKWENVTAAVIFRVELATGVRYQVNTFFKSRRVRFVIGADLRINDEGSLVNKGVELTSKAGRNIIGSFEMVGMLLGILFFLHSW